MFGLLPFIARSLVVETTLVVDELDAKYDKLYLEGKYVAEAYLKMIMIGEMSTPKKVVTTQWRKHRRKK